LQAAEAGELRLAPLYLRPSVMDKEHPLSRYQGLNSPDQTPAGKPKDRRDRIFASAAQQLKQLIGRSGGSVTPVPPVPRLPFEPETVLIPAGPFWMGSQPGPSIPEHETPRHQVVLPAYQVGRYPVTNHQYEEFIKQEGQQDAPAGWFLRQPPKDKLEHPVVGVSWYDNTRVYCDWLSRTTGRRYCLPTEAEWEKAARGTDGRRYPWGDDWDAGCCQQGSASTAPVTAHPEGASIYGCCDLLGNVQEWTSHALGQ
jgi:formylglycine-generating enzyme required for sulfatase activity